MGWFYDLGDRICKFFRRAWNFVILNMMGCKWLFVEMITKHKSFDITGIPPRPEQVAIITGGARGIGLEVIKKLLQCQMDVIMGCRSVEAGTTVINSIRQSGITTGNVECLPLDLMSFNSVRAFANAVLERKKSIHLLINNAGIMAVPYAMTKDGYESQLQVNHFGHFLLTNLLLPTIIKTSQTENIVPRIVNVNSVAMYNGEVYYDGFDKRHYYDQYQTYTDSKLFPIVTCNYLDRKLKKDGHRVNIVSLHPGIIPTDLWQSSPFFVKWTMALIHPVFRTILDGAEDVTYAALSPEIENESAIFLRNNKICSTVAKADDKMVQEKLWEASCKVVELSA